MVLDGSVAVSDLNTTEVDARYVNTGDAYADLEDAGHLDDNANADVQTRAGMIVTFLALLEMIRLKLIRVFQQANFGPIRVYKRARPDGAPVFDGS